MSEEQLSPQPTPEAETPEKFPGGADNLADEEKYGDRGPLEGPAGRDLAPEKNPAVDEAVPDDVAEPDDKEQEGSGEPDEPA